MAACLIIVLFVFVLNATAQTPCEKLKDLELEDATISEVEFVPAGPYTIRVQKSSPAAKPPDIQLPAHCRVAAVLKPSSDSHIEMEVWLPAEDWNGKFQAVGNGGWAGTISYSAMASALQEGYATASTDTGHKGANALFGIGHPEKVVDYAYRAVHETTVQSKTIIAAFYGKQARFSYWNGCSTGGRQGLMSAQRYPEDFDAIVAGAPANFHSHLHASDLAVSVPILLDKASSVSRTQLAMLHRAVIASCDEIDGVKDGILTDPRQCHFDPSDLLCRAGSNDICLTPSQLTAIQSIYAPSRMRTGEVIFPGKALGSELGWRTFSGSTPPAVALGTFYLTYQDPDWDWRTFDADRDTVLADQKTGFINAIQPDLTAFKARGGKLLLYHGWNDTSIAPENTVNYYSSVLAKMGADQGDWVRLFMVPGMGHCRGGEGPSQANFFSAMERWRESGTPPDHITAYRVSGNSVNMTRPLCPYPQDAKYKGIGSTNDAENFLCSE
jgi:feruloyl esterase